MEALRGKTTMTIPNQNVAKARDLLSAIEDLGCALELMSQALEDDCFRQPFGQIGTIIREKADAADDLLIEQTKNVG
jgi:hypothetical protein